MRLGLIGFGSIGESLIRNLNSTDMESATILVRPDSNAAGRLGDLSCPDLAVRLVNDFAALLEAGPDLIVECAGHSAVEEYGPRMLEAGIDLLVASVGALANSATEEKLRIAAAQSGARLIIPSGAIGGLDLVRALARMGEIEVVYKGIKPPAAWRGTPAEKVVDLGNLSGPYVFFSGTARQAALAYPKNANVAASLALAGTGFDRTHVDLIADPKATANQHTYTVRSAQERFEVVIEGNPSSENPRTSQTTAFSILTEIEAYRPTCALVM